MPNMSYCRFRNTVDDLRDCWDNIYEVPDAEEEARARLRLIKICKKIADACADEIETA